MPKSACRATELRVTERRTKLEGVGAFSTWGTNTFGDPEGFPNEWLEEAPKNRVLTFWYTFPLHLPRAYLILFFGVSNNRFIP